MGAMASQVPMSGDERFPNAFYVFGTGFVASMLVEALRAHGALGGVRGYLVSRCDEPRQFEGAPVLSASDEAVDRSMPVYVAVHESNAAEVVRLLEQFGFTQVIWVYPHLYDLLYGEPLYRGIFIEVRQILEAQDPSYHWLAIRALAAEALRGQAPEQRNAALDAYVKAQAVHCGFGTARKRLGCLGDLLDAMKDGFDSERPILIDADFRIIDGLHRMAVAWLLGIERIACDIVKPSPVFDRVLTYRNKLTDDALAEAGLTDAQFAMIRQMSDRMGCGAAAPEISFIVPAYNVADYVDQFVESARAQTFGDFEMLLIDDGSTDGTGMLCEQCARRDARIHCVRKANTGVSPTRNLGLELARGTYVAFADPDDWLDERYLEKLHDAAVREGADFAECDIWRYDNRTGKKIHRACGQRMGVRYTLEEHMKYGPTASYKAISKRSLWMDNDVRFPDCSFESPAIYALVLALAGEKSAYVPEPLYYYRRFRENSLVETAYAKTPGVADNSLGVEAMAHLCRQFKERGLYERYASEMPGLVAYRLNDILAMQYHRRSAEDFTQLVANQRVFLEQAFPQLPEGAYLTWGGYNLNKILQHLPMLNDPSCRFNFSSIVAVAYAGDSRESATGVTIHHKNRYREMMLQREIDQAFWSVLVAQRPRFVFMDFVDERFDLLKWRGRYLTASDAWEGAQPEGIEPEGRVAFGSQEHLVLWCSSFDALSARLAQLSSETQLVIVENYLAERVGTLASTREHEDAEAIRATNVVLKSLYDHVREMHPDTVVIPAYACQHYFTDEAYEYGAVPQHLNDIVNQRIAQQIEGAIVDAR